VLQRLAFQKLHADEVLTVLLAYVVNGADVWVIQSRRGQYTVKHRNASVGPCDVPFEWRVVVFGPG
jgi:hypothetical protein